LLLAQEHQVLVEVLLYKRASPHSVVLSPLQQVAAQAVLVVQ